MTRLIVLFIIMTAGYLFPNDLILVDKYESHLLMNPLQITINENNIYIFDSEGDKPFYIFNKNNGKFIKAFGDWGRGPGEVIKYGSLARIIGFTQNKIIVTDPVSKKYIEFDERGNFVKEYMFPEFIRTSLNTILTDQRKIMLSGFGPEKSFGITYQLNEDLTINKSSKKFLGIYDEIPELINCKNNPLLKQGPICYDDEGNIFLTFHFSSLMLGFGTDNNLIFKTDEPERIPIPEVNSENNTFRAPDLKENPEVHIGIAVDKDFLYIIYSGTWLKTLWQLLTQKDELLSGKSLRIYDKKSSKLIKDIELSHTVNDIAVDDNIYLLSTDDTPKIIIYKYIK